MHLGHHAPGNELAEPSSVQGISRPASAGSVSQRPIQDYQLEQDLQAACDALAKAEQAQPKLHLVVLGHVDAGKSTLMGRLLHDLGWVSGCSDRPPDWATWLPALHPVATRFVAIQMQLLCNGHTTQCCLRSIAACFHADGVMPVMDCSHSVPVLIFCQCTRPSLSTCTRHNTYLEKLLPAQCCCTPCLTIDFNQTS